MQVTEAIKPPLNHSGITPEWLTQALAARHPGAVIGDAVFGTPIHGTGTNMRITLDYSRLSYPTLLKGFFELGQDIEQVADQAVIGDLEDRGVFILVDGDDDLAVLHAGEMLDGAGDADGDVEFRGEMENRIKECRLDLFADRTSAHTMRANQLRLWFASMAYGLICTLRRIGLVHTQFAQATCATIRLKLLGVAY